MFTKQEASLLRQEFWTTLGQYLSPIPSASGEKINWINYKTGVKGVQFKMDAEGKYAHAGIEISGDEERREILYQLFKTLAHNYALEYEWVERCENEHGKQLCRIYTELEGYHIFNKDNWPLLISFFKQAVMEFDAFWKEQKDIFELSV